MPSPALLGPQSPPRETPPAYPLRKKSPGPEPPWPSPQLSNHPSSAPPANLLHSIPPPVRVSLAQSPPPKKNSSGAPALPASKSLRPAAQSPPTASTRPETTSPSPAPPRRLPLPAEKSSAAARTRY